MKYPAVLAAAFVALAAGPAPAQSGLGLVEAQRAGIVGERFDGYLVYTDKASPSVRRQVGAINIRRRSLYTDLATRRNVNVQAVGIAAGCELLAKVATGETYMLTDGAWRTRAAGQSAPIPDYCGK